MPLLGQKIAGVGRVASTFVGLSDKEVAALRSADSAVEAIQQRGKSGRPLSFPWLRAHFGRDRDIWDQLGRGTSILGSNDQLDQYLYSYGPMISCQWDALTEGRSLTPGAVRLVDYGCGQGLAGLLLFDRFGDAFAPKLTQAVLIEPSPQALVRAEAVYSCIAPDSEIICVNKGFDQVCTADVMADPVLDTIHVFSNVLDVTGFDQYRLLGQVMTPGKHTLLVVSPDRDFDGGTARIRGLKAAIEDPKHADALTVLESTLQEFTCGPSGKYPVVTWFANLEVPNG
jgi:hypothetical protein